MIGKLHTIADQLFQAITKADQPIEPDVTKKPWLAALWSIVIIGAGQLYNRQLAKGIWYFVAAYVPTGIVVGVYFLLSALVDPETSPGWLVMLTDYFRLASLLVAFLFCLLWGFAAMDAYRTAILLRDGQLAVQYGLKRQALHMAVGFVPGVGELVPDETVKLEAKRPSLAELFQAEVRQRIVRRIVTRLVGFGCMFVLMLLLLVGLIIGVLMMVSAGGLKIK